MDNENRRRRKRRRNWYIILIALFLLGMSMGLRISGRLSARAPDPSGSPGVSLSPTPTPVPTPAPTPSPTPTPAPTPSLSPAQEVLAGMTLREKVCQMFVVFPSALTGEPVVTQAGDSARQALEEYPVGGLIFDASNMVSQEQVRALLAGFQSCSRVPLILTCDEEGGRVGRLMGTVGTTKIGPMLDYGHLGPEVARANARTIAADMVSCGFNTDLAPVADVWSNPANTVIGDRAYSQDFQTAAQLIPAAVEGFHAGGVACALKHFPGHGDTAQDSHTGAAYVDKSLDRLRQEELLPFRAGMDAGADMVMMGHLTVPQADSLPAPFSHKLVTELLREEMGFDGVVITDSLQMQAVTGQYSSGEVAVLAVQAGVDLLLCPESLEEGVAALLDAVERGTITQERLDESVLRILEMKQARGMLS